MAGFFPGDFLDQDAEGAAGVSLEWVDEYDAGPSDMAPSGTVNLQSSGPTSVLGVTWVPSASGGGGWDTQEFNSTDGLKQEDAGGAVATVQILAEMRDLVEAGGGPTYDPHLDNIWVRIYGDSFVDNASASNQACIDFHVHMSSGPDPFGEYRLIAGRSGALRAFNALVRGTAFSIDEDVARTATDALISINYCGYGGGVRWQLLSDTDPVNPQDVLNVGSSGSNGSAGIAAHGTNLLDLGSLVDIRHVLILGGGNGTGTAFNVGGNVSRIRVSRLRVA